MANKYRGFILAILSIIYPVIYMYSINATILEIGSLWRILALAVPFALVLYAFFYWITHKDLTAAGIGVAIFTLFLFSYGPLFDFLLSKDKFVVSHLTLLPLWIILSIYSIILVVRLKKETLTIIQNSVFLVLIGLTLYNVIIIVPSELQKSATAALQANKPTPVPAVAGASIAKNYPDVYYFLFDEYAGPEAIQTYWKDSDVKNLEDFLKARSFYFSKNSHGNTIDTLVEMASRLNLTIYPLDTNVLTLFDAIANNKVMSTFKSMGYTTVVFDTATLAYEGKIPVRADYNLSFDPETMKAEKPVVDEFARLVLDMTMFRTLSKFYYQENSIKNYRSSILFPLEKVNHLSDVQTPKFVYTHLLLPHWPFIFDANGSAVDSKFYWNWNYYLGQHQYTTQKIEELVTNLLQNADPKNPPIIIIQSDHGARNIKSPSPDGIILQNYPDELKTSIINAIYIPGYDITQFPESLSPYDDFPILLKQLFNISP